VTQQRTTARADAARPVSPPSFSVTCARCQVQHVSTVPTLPEGWAIITAGVRCPDCKPKGRAVPNG
jgi:hypothetical protein